MNQSLHMSCHECKLMEAYSKFQLAFLTAFPKLGNIRIAVTIEKEEPKSEKKSEEVNYQDLYSWEPSEWELLDNL